VWVVKYEVCETNLCECGHHVPIELAVGNDEGQYICIDCYDEMIADTSARGVWYCGECGNEFLKDELEKTEAHAHTCTSCKEELKKVPNENEI
jgi:ribosomal protein L37AE/L43A